VIEILIAVLFFRLAGRALLTTGVLISAKLGTLTRYSLQLVRHWNSNKEITLGNYPGTKFIGLAQQSIAGPNSVCGKPKFVPSSTVPLTSNRAEIPRGRF